MGTRPCKVDQSRKGGCCCTGRKRVVRPRQCPRAYSPQETGWHCQPDTPQGHKIAIAAIQQGHGNRKFDTWIGLCRGGRYSLRGTGCTAITSSRCGRQRLCFRTADYTPTDLLPATKRAQLMAPAENGRVGKTRNYIGLP